MNSQARATFMRLLAAQRPNPTTELLFDNHYQLLVAVVLSAQTTDVAVNRATAALFTTIKTPEQMVALGEARLKQHIKTIGLYNTKARHLIALSHQLITTHQSRVPASRDALQALPGVGRKTANVILNTAFGEPTIAVDTHVFRVSNRTGLAPARSLLGVERALLKRLPKQYLLNAHHLLILHGRYQCTARKPRCTRCIVNHCCDYYRARPTASV